ncbi:N-terminal domain of NEFA-interacting nuclear protein NIP30-domain-containing protein [Abortiporus biennis]|nr:N-terminal domain of NEFA-interacting nuclear protein NIP30-domain-containing protein [Abortiporus biennis]
MEDIPSISSGSVGSRFVSQSEIETAKARRDEQWKAAYARLGQEPPPQPVEDVFDGRSLAEKLAANRAAKQEEWEERNKLGNQFRALEEDEVLFLDSVLEKQREEERIRNELDGKELKNFREAVLARENAAKPPPVASKPSSSTSTAATKPSPAPVVKKDTKKSLKGVLVKKKSKPGTVAKQTSGNGKPTTEPTTQSTTKKEKEDKPEDGDDNRQAKRRKINNDREGNT